MTDPNLRVTAPACPFCGHRSIVTMTRPAFEALKAGTAPNVALPDLGPDEWELFISGTCSPCWEQLKGPDD